MATLYQPGKFVLLRKSSFKILRWHLLSAILYFRVMDHPSTRPSVRHGVTYLMPYRHISTPHKCHAGPRSGPTAEMNIRVLSPLILFGPFILELSSVVYRCTLGIKIKAIHSFKIAHSESMCLGDNNCRNVALI